MSSSPTEGSIPFQASVFYGALPSSAEETLPLPTPATTDDGFRQAIQQAQAIITTASQELAQAIDRQSQAAARMTIVLAQALIVDMKAMIGAPPSPVTYLVQPGDSLFTIAQKQLGDARAYAQIMQVNGMGGIAVYPGQIIQLPVSLPTSTTGS